MKLLFCCYLIAASLTVAAQKPRNGVYIYSVAFAEWDGKSMGLSVKVSIKGDSIFVFHNGGNLTGGKKGDLMESGIIMKHAPTGQWIIGKSAADKNTPDVGGCSDGPTVIDFKRKRYWLC